MGPPGGFNARQNGFAIQSGKLWIAFNAQYNKNFLRSPQEISEANQRWIGWYGSLSEGILNYMCLSYDTAKYTYCETNGQPLAPAADPSEEIYEILMDVPEWFDDFKGV
eukprot:UN01187